MKIFRDVMAAILLGIIGGLLVTTFLYYNNHKEGGIFHTLMAVVNSYDVVTDAYDKTPDDALDKVKNYDVGKVLETFQNMDDEEFVTAYTNVLNSLMEGADDGSEGDVLVMEGEDGDVMEGMPYSGILRFHVRANSDSEKDQELKMAVKDDVVTMLNPMLKNCKDVAESKNLIVANLSNIYETAVNTITEQGYDYPVSVYVTEEEFPAKSYGDLTFPAGKYQALRVDIGEAKGQNWWCVMFPPLCFIDESTAIVSEDGKKMLRDNLTDREFRALFLDPDTEIDFKW